MDSAYTVLGYNGTPAISSSLSKIFYLMTVSGCFGKFSGYTIQQVGRKGEMAAQEQWLRKNLTILLTF